MGNVVAHIWCVSDLFNYDSCVAKVEPIAWAIFGVSIAVAASILLGALYMRFKPFIDACIGINKQAKQKKLLQKAIDQQQQNYFHTEVQPQMVGYMKKWTPSTGLVNRLKDPVKPAAAIPSIPVAAFVEDKKTT
jgi:hypothetical protein